jgi:hypothetical protein
MPELELKRGTQIIYVPTHADGWANHPDCEEGFVTSVRGDTAFCRYWSKLYAHPVLRTKANSEGTPIENIVVHKSVPQSAVDNCLSIIDKEVADAKTH